MVLCTVYSRWPSKGRRRRGKTSRAYRRKQRNRAAEEAARDAAGEVPWALLVGEEWEDGQQQEPTGEWPLLPGHGW